jgi:hypothetical protein
MTNSDPEIILNKIEITKPGPDTNDGNVGNEEGSALLPNIKKFRKDSVRMSKRKKNVLIISGLILSILLIVLLLTSLLFYRVYKDGMVVRASSEKLVDAAKTGNLELIKLELANTRTSVNMLKKSYGRIAWAGNVPFVGFYIKDAGHLLNAANPGFDAADILITTIEPYSDIVGLGDIESPEDQESETAQDRLDFVINTISDVIPRADELSEKLNQVRIEIDKINPEKYPEEFRGIVVRENIKKVIDMVDMGDDILESGRPLLRVAPYLLGIDSPRRYLIIFQNDKELRPTGGFLTAYSIAEVEKGKFEPAFSNDIYNIDINYRPTIDAPAPMVKYLKGPYILSRKLRLRDMNWSPDFYESMNLFTKEAKSVGIDNIDGVIAVDTRLLENILHVIGPIDVPEFGRFSSDIIPECNCPQVIYELESYSSVEGPVVWSQDEPGKIIFGPANRDNRKKIIGPLMNSILSHTLGQPKEKIPALFQAVFDSVMQKHVLFYLYGEENQKAVEEFGIAGRIIDYDGDYLHINDANLGGRKSNLYVTEEVVQDIEIAKDGTIEKTVTVTYKNPEKHDGWLNSVLPNWVRFYVPAGSELISMEGFEEKAEPYEELGKTVYAGYFQLRPQGVAKITVRYKLPIKAEKEYNIMIQKQPGKHTPLYLINIGKQSEEFFLKTDKELKFKN